MLLLRLLRLGDNVPLDGRALGHDLAELGLLLGALLIVQGDLLRELSRVGPRGGHDVHGGGAVRGGRRCELRRSLRQPKSS